MKKFLSFVAVATISAPIFIGCNGIGKVSIRTECDSLNYAFGILNADNMSRFVFGNDTTVTIADKEQFCTGFESMYNNETLNPESHGYRIGASMAQEFQSGYLFNDSTIPAKPELIATNLENALNGDLFMHPDSANTLFRNLMSKSFVEGGSAELTPEQADSVNMILGLINARGVKNFILAGDTTKSDIKKFMKGFRTGLQYTEAEKWKLQGMEVASQFRQQLAMSKYLFNDSTLPISKQHITAGIKAMILGDTTVMTVNSAEEYFTKIMEAKAEERNREAAAPGRAFLAENATKEGVVVTESGLQYKAIVMGYGPKPTATDKVKVHYEGSLIDGTVFDSSIQRGEPIVFGLNQVIKGWTEGLQLMPVGSEFELYIPYELAYGEQGAGSMIGPCQTLIFKVQLLGIEK